jgi:hypothetical protein
MNKIVLTATMLVVVAGAQARQELRQEIQRRYDTIAKVAVADPQQMINEAARFLTSDFQWVETAGSEYNREFYIGIQTKLAGQISKVFAAKNEIVSYRESGIYVICRVKSSQLYRRKGFSSDRHSAVSVTDDTWVKTIHGWKMYRSVGIRDSDTIVRRGVSSQSAAVMTARMTSAGVVHPAAALAFPSSSIVR